MRLSADGLLYLCFIMQWIPQLCSALTLLPYVQLDYAYFFKLTVCRARCTEKYGWATEIELLDGRRVERTQETEELQRCVHSCSSRRRQAADEPSRDGIEFWKMSSTDSKKVGSSPVSRISLLCLNVRDGEEAEGRLLLETSRQVRAEQFLIQWKLHNGHWITASIENTTMIHVDGFVPGNEYKFMVTVVGPNGRLGESLQSEWMKVPLKEHRDRTADLSASSSACPAGGVCAAARWKHLSTDTCHYRVKYENSTHEIIRDIVMDGSQYVLLPNLNYSTSYELSLQSLDADFERAREIASTRFETVSCSQVFGAGSLQCPPSPPASVHVVVLNSSSLFVSWLPPSNSSSILTNLVSAEFRPPCQAPQASAYVKEGHSTELSLPFPANSCDLLIRVTTFDLLGREAASESLLPASSPTHSFAPSLAHLIPSLFYLIIPLCIALFLIVLLIVILRLRAAWRSKSNSKKKSRRQAPPTFV